MDDRCQFLEQCGFYKKFCGKSSAAWRGLFDTYCRGGLVQRCERNRLYQSKEVQFSDEMMPNGRDVPGVFKMLH